MCYVVSVCSIRTNCRKLAPNVQDHDARHAQREDVHEVGRGFKDNGVGELDAACVACCFYSRRARDWGWRAQEGAEGERRFLAYRREVAKAHGGLDLGGMGVLVVDEDGLSLPDE